MSPPVSRPAQTGIVHLGVGAFARAHTFHYTELAAERAGSCAWGILGVTGRRPESAEVLRAQEEVYGVLFREGSQSRLRWVGSLTGVAASSERHRVTAAIAHEQTRVVTLTVTEKAYAPDSVPLGLLAHGLRRRHEAGGAPLTVLSCDNLLSNGRRLEQLVRHATRGAPAAFQRWLADDVAFPCSVVDRITPSTTAVDRDEAGTLSGFADAALVVAEPFGQWVIEDDFAGSRPPWELAGAVFVADVEVYEAGKLRLLNGAHTLIACAGAVLGHTTIVEAMGDPRLLRWCRRWQEEVQRTLPALDGVDWGDYAREVRGRFSNQGLTHTTAQIARDTSQKVGMRILEPVLEALAQGRGAPAGAFAVGAWAALVLRQVETGGELDDPLASDFAELVGRSHRRVDAVVEGLLDLVVEEERRGALGAAFVREAADHARCLLTGGNESDDGACRNSQQGATIWL